MDPFLVRNRISKSPIMQTLPILYSFRRCPYAIRARMAIKVSRLQVELREVTLTDKPQSLLDYSAKATVPVLILPDGAVIDESVDIMNWALSLHDPKKWLANNQDIKQQFDSLIDSNDGKFKLHLDHYKYADRFPEQPMHFYRDQAEDFITELDERLNHNEFLCGESLSFADVAIFPFIRQFYFVDKEWFEQSDYSHLQAWLEYLLQDPLFLSIMDKYKPWQPDDELILL